MPTELVPGLPLRPIAIDEYDRMVELGVLPHDAKVELLDGLLVAVSPQSPEHATAVQRLTDWAYDHVDRERHSIRVQLPLRCEPASEPEPDLALVPAGARVGAHPSRAALVVEVAHSSAAADLEVKPRLYAAAGAGEYWVVLVTERRIRVHRAPERTGRWLDVLDVRAAEFEGATLTAAELLD